MAAAGGAAAAAPAAAAAIAMPVWSLRDGERRRQADAWMGELKRAHGVGTRGESTEQQLARAAALLASGIGPGWDVTAPGEESVARGAALSFYHEDVNNGNRIYGGWLNVGRLVAAARVRAAQAQAEGVAAAPAAAGGGGAAAGLAAAPAAAAEAAAADAADAADAAAAMPAEKDGIRALEQVEQLLSDGGALAQYVRQHGAAMAEEAPASMLAPAGVTPVAAAPDDDDDVDAPMLALQDDLEVRAGSGAAVVRTRGGGTRAARALLTDPGRQTPTAGRACTAHAQGGERAGVLHRHRGHLRHRQVNDVERRADADGG
jgi:hypothetical protein